jgi:gliding motility-associated-like protein
MIKFYATNSLLFILAILLHGNAKAQFVNITQGSSISLPCDSDCANINITKVSVKKTDFYSVASIPFDTLVPSGPTTLNLSDDSFSTNILLGFQFCFFNNIYNQVYISRNGVITFNPIYANSPCSFNTAQTLPFSSNTFPDLGIFGPFMDLTTGANATIKYKMIGNAPYRRFVLDYKKLPLFGAACVSATNSFQIVLHETFNYIDMQIIKKSVCNANALDTINYATMGIQGGGNFLTVAGRNGSVWTATNQGFRFAPAGVDDYSISYSVNSGAIIQSNNDSATVCGGSYPKRCIVTYTKFCPSAVAKDTIMIDKYRPTIDSIVKVQPICAYSNNGSITVYGTTIFSPLTYRLNSGAYLPGNLFNNLNAGIDTIYIKDANNCTAAIIDTLIPKSKVKLVIDSTKDADCLLPNGAVYVSGNMGAVPYTYLWQNGSTLPYITNIFGDSSISVKITDALGCVDSNVVKADKKGPLAIKDSIIAPGCTDSNGKIFIHVDTTLWTPPFTYLWSTGATTQDITNCVGNTAYSVIITDSSGCKKTSTFLVLYDSLPSVIINKVSKPTCQKSNGVYTAVASGGTPPYTYLWNNATTTAINTTADSGALSVTITDFKGCKANFLVNIIDTLDMVLYKSSINTTCNFSNGTATVGAGFGMASFTYLWSTGQTTNAITNLSPGTYTATVTDFLACVKTIAVTINASPPLSIVGTFKNASCDSTNGFINLTISNATNPVQYNWSNGDTTKNITALAAGSYTILVTDAANCSATKSFTIADDGKPYPLITNYTPPLCAGDSTGVMTLLGAGGVGPYKYSLDGITFTTSPTISNIAAGTYTLLVKDANSCVQDTIITLADATPILVVFPTYTPLVCYFDKVPKFSINPTGGYPPYLYRLDNDNFTNSNQMSNLGIGIHTIYIKDSIGCVKPFLQTVLGPDSALQAASVQKNIPCFETNTGRLKAIIAGGWPPYTWQWSNGATSLILDSIAKGTYILGITDSKGCEADIPFEILQTFCCDAIVPNAFTPNGDGYNETIFVIPRAPISEMQWAIYDRWGGKIFDTKNVADKWDGTWMGKPMPMETYFYKLKYKCSFDENSHYLQGEFVLLR